MIPQNVTYKYSYPHGLKLNPQSDMHAKLVAMLTDRALLGYNNVSDSFDKWRDTDRVMRTYMPQDETERKVSAEDSRKPTSIIYPYSLAIKETILAHLCKVLLSTPIIRYQGIGGEDLLGALLLEKVVNTHMTRNKVLLKLHTLLDDDLKYGLGYIVPTWDNGNAAETINPYHALLDPNAPATELKKAEFFGWVERTNYYRVLAKEQQDQNYFNGQYVQHTTKSQSAYYAIVDDMHNYATNVNKPAVSLKMYARLIPREWELGPSVYPEFWFFELINDSVLVTAQQANIDYYPVVVGSTNFDGYGSFPLSRVESLLGMQKTLDWMINSHVAAVRQGVNNRFVVDPSMINMKDLKSGAPYIRTRKMRWGRGIDDGLKQLQVYDVTARHVGDSSYLVNAMQKVAGADEATMGTMRETGPERLTSAEFQGTREGLQARMERMVQVLGVQVIQDLGRQYAYNTGHFMQEPEWVDLTGSYQGQLAGIFGGSERIMVAPNFLRVGVDVQPVPGYYGERGANTLLELLNVLMGSEELTQTFDIPRVVKYILSSAGVRNVDSFERVQTQVMPDEQVMNEQDKGNLIPMFG